MSVALTPTVRAWRAACVALAMLSLGACASQSTPDEIAHVQETNDPYEPMNRAIFAFNEGLDVVVLKPLAVWYTFFVPFQDARDTIRRVIDNATLPWTAINEVFQGEWNRAGTSTTRFLINTTLGIGGMIDWATRWGYEHHSEDFGLTLARRFGVREGPYLVLPVFGPRNVRDTFGLVADNLGDPIGWILPFPGGLVRSGVDGIDQRSRYIEEIDQLRRDSLDFYATLRSITRQRRQAQVDRGEGQRQDIPRVVSDETPAAPPALATPPTAPAAGTQGRPVAQQAPTRGPAARIRSPAASSQPAAATQPGAAALPAAPQASAPSATPWVTPQAEMAAVPASPSRNAAPIRMRPDGSWVVDPSLPSQGR